jgi:hypothetical protein
MKIRQARKRAAFSVLLNLVLTTGKGVAGVIGGLSALVGDAIHSATDVVGSLAAWFIDPGGGDQSGGWIFQSGAGPVGCGWGNGYWGKRPTKWLS